MNRTAVAATTAAVLLSTLCLTLPTPLLAKTPKAEPSAAGLAAKLDQMLSAAYPADQPGASAIVVHDGQTLLRRGYGLADVELGVKIEPNMVFRIGSITKQFTAVLTLLMVGEGKIDLEAPFQQYLTEYPTYEHPISVEHLLTHTSGIPSYTGLPEWRGRLREDFAVSDILDLFKDLPLEFEPGSEFRYNNSGYILLGAVLEAVSGKSYEELAEERIFLPLGMTRSDYGSFGRVIPGRVQGYHRDGGQLVNAPYLSMTLPYAAGSLLSTVDDLATWNTALRAGKVLPLETLAKMQTEYRLTNDEGAGYGYGWNLGSHHDSPVVQHGGGIHGFSTFALEMPKEKLYIAVLSNDPQGSFGPGLAAQLAADLTLGHASQRIAVEVDLETLQSYAGVYRIDEATTRTVTFEDGTLYTQRSGGGKNAARPASKVEFYYDTSAARFRFEQDAEGAVVGMVMVPWGGAEERAVRTDESLPEAPEVVSVSEAALERVAGEYELQPGFVLSFRREGDHLIGNATGQSEIEIYPSSELHYFSQAIGAEMEFVADDAGKIVSVILKQGGQVLEGKRLD